MFFTYYTFLNKKCKQDFLWHIKYKYVYTGIYITYSYNYVCKKKYYIDLYDYFQQASIYIYFKLNSI